MGRRLPDVLVLVGGVLTSVGLWWISPACAVILVGLSSLSIGVALYRRRENG